MPRNQTAEQLDWLNQNPRLEDLIARYPAMWEEVGQELFDTAKTGRSQKLNQLAERARASADLWRGRIQKSGANPKVVESAVREVARSRMLLLALDKCSLAAASGKVSGKVRFNLVNGYVIQKLLFKRDLERKPASLGWFNFFWRFITQKKLLLPLVQSKGIYCFYSQELIEELSRLIGERPCLEIAAGDGTLARFMKERGINLVATDDLSWRHTIKYPENVENLEAKEALAKYRPEVVLCSWPPPGNSFERHVFLTESVQLYIVIGSELKFSSGNWKSYEEQKDFDWAIDKRLSALVIPPRSNHVVLVFRRRAGAPGFKAI